MDVFEFVCRLKIVPPLGWDYPYTSECWHEGNGSDFLFNFVFEL